MRAKINSRCMKEGEYTPEMILSRTFDLGTSNLNYDR